jgi:protein TonB
MSRRRRQRNPLLVRIIVISLVAHVIALPILAHFGAFEKVRKSFGTANVVMLEPEKKVVKPPPPVKKKAKAQTQNSAKGQNKGKAAARADLPKVAVQDGPGGGDAPAVDQGTKTGGALLPGTNTGPPKATDSSEPKTTVVGTPPNVKALSQPPVTPTPPTKPPVTTVTKPKHIPVFTEVEPVYQPEPTIPDDLRDQPLDKTAVIEVTVGADGSIATAELSKGTGIRELDVLAVRTAKTWKFKPATADGEAVSGKLRLRIEFKVE